jgi:uncharacterized protein (TIGR03083 family)
MGAAPVDKRALLARCWTAWAERLTGLAPDQWRTPTRCDPWSVHDLAAHVAPDPDLLATIGSQVVEQQADLTDAADLLRRFNEPGGVARTMAADIAEMAMATAAALGPGDLVERFTAGAEAVATSDLEPAAVVPHPVGALVTVDVLTDVAIVEAVAHLLDLIDAVGGAAPPDPALGHVRDLLARVPDAGSFVAAATGRTAADGVLPVMR